MKKLLLTVAVVGLFLNISCDPKASPVQEEDTTSEKVLEGDQTPSQYQGSTGVEDDNNNMVANENIQLKKQEFKGSFATGKTQSYTFTVIDSAKDYSFRLETKYPEIKYLINHKDGKVIQEATSEDTTLTLAPGEYTVIGVLDTKEGAEQNPNKEFTVYIE